MISTEQVRMAFISKALLRLFVAVIKGSADPGIRLLQKNGKFGDILKPVGFL